MNLPGTPPADPPAPAGIRAYLREIVFASVVALVAVAGAVQAVAGFRTGNRASISNGGDCIFLAAVICGLWLWGYWAHAARRKLDAERKFAAKLEVMRAELLAELLETNEGIGRVADLLEPRQEPKLAVVHQFPGR